MKAPVFLFAFALSAAGLAAADVAPGAALPEVRASLGVPRGQLRVGGRQVLYYDRGEVELQGGRVTRVALRTAEEQAALAAREESQRAGREARRAELVAAGTALRDRRLADATFAAAPVSYQLSFWQDFAQRFPDLPAGDPLAIARARFNDEAAVRRRQEDEATRLAELEERAAAEQTTFYPVADFGDYYGGYYGRHRPHYYSSSGPAPFEYNFSPTSLPPYTTPSGLPGGDLRPPRYNVPVVRRAPVDHFREHRDRMGRSDAGDRDRSFGRWRERG